MAQRTTCQDLMVESTFHPNVRSADAPYLAQESTPTKLLAARFPTEWEDYLTANVRHYAHLPPAQRASMQRIVQVVAAEKHWVGGRGFKVTDEMKVTIAGQASLLVLGFESRTSSTASSRSSSTRGRSSIRPVSATLFDRAAGGDAAGRGLVSRADRAVVGERTGRRPRAGRRPEPRVARVRHYVDGLDGEFDGVPPLSSAPARRSGDA